MKNWHRCDRWTNLGLKRCPFQAPLREKRKQPRAKEREADPEDKAQPVDIPKAVPPIHRPTDKRPGTDIEQEVMDLLEEIRAREPAVEKAIEEQEKVGSGEPEAIPVSPVHTPEQVRERTRSLDPTDPREGAPRGFVPSPVLNPDAEPIGVRLALGSAAMVSEVFGRAPRTVTTSAPVRSTVRRTETTRVTSVRPSATVRRVPGDVRASLAEAAVTQELQEQLEERRQMVTVREPVGGRNVWTSLALAIAAGLATGGGGAFMFNAARRMRGLLEGAPARSVTGDGNQGNLPNEPTE